MKRKLSHSIYASHHNLVLSCPVSQQCSSRLIPSFNPKRDYNPNANVPNDAPQRRKLAVVLQKDVNGIVDRPTGQVTRAEIIQGSTGNARGRGRGDATRVHGEGLEAVGGGGFGALNALESLYKRI